MILKEDGARRRRWRARRVVTGGQGSGGEGKEGSGGEGNGQGWWWWRARKCW